MAKLEWPRLFQAAAMQLQHNWRLEIDDTLLHSSYKPGWKKCIVSTSARFNCTKCGRGWSSNNVRVVCYLHLAHGQGVVKARPFRQNCKVCSEAPMEKPSIYSENISILMDNLVEKIKIKCYNADPGKNHRHFRSFDAKNPHEPAHCEACMQGVCPKNKRY